MTYKVILQPIVIEQLKLWARSGKPKSLKKIESFLDELSEHPYTGTGKVERLSGDMTGYYSRRIDKKNRLIYAVDDDVVIVTVVSAMGHYEGD